MKMFEMADQLAWQECKEDMEKYEWFPSEVSKLKFKWGILKH